MFVLMFQLFFCEASLRRYTPFSRITSPTSDMQLCPDIISRVKFSSTSSPYEGLKIFEISREGLAPWPSKNQKKLSTHPPIDISQFCADPEKGLLYRYQSNRDSQKISQSKEKFPLFKGTARPFDRFSKYQKMADVFSSMGLVESFYDLGNLGILTTIGTGFLIRPDMAITAAHNVTIDPKDSEKIKSPMEPSQIRFHLRYDEGSSDDIHEVSKYKTPKEWSIGRDNTYDFAALFFPNSIQETKIKLASIEPNMKLPIPIHVAGYPNKIPNQTFPTFKVLNDPLCSYTNDGELKEISSCRKIIGYNCLTEEGVSGGPVIVRDLPIALGLHTRGCFDLNRGVHHFEHMKSYIEKWIQESEKPNDSTRNEIVKIISELVQSDDEKNYLLSIIDKLKNYPIENIRQYITVLLDTRRP